MGTSLPGYRAGWFRLRNGEKALLYVTDPAKAVYVPTQLDYSVIVTPQDPEGFLSAIHRQPASATLIERFVVLELAVIFGDCHG